jgi:hypothetical protein
MPDEALIKEVAKEAEKRAEDVTDTEKEFQVETKLEFISTAMRSLMDETGFVE